MQIVLTADPNLIGRLIRWFTKISWVGKGRVSHVALRYGREESNWMIEANERGFVPNWWTYFVKKRHVYAKFEVLGIDESLLEKIVDEQIDVLINRPYDYGNLIGFALTILWYKLTGKRTKNFLAFPRLFACSEIVYRIFTEVKNQTGIDYLGDYDPEQIFPEQILQECENKPGLFRLVTN